MLLCSQRFEGQDYAILTPACLLLLQGVANELPRATARVGVAGRAPLPLQTCGAMQSPAIAALMTETPVKGSAAVCPPSAAKLLGLGKRSGPTYRKPGSSAWEFGDIYSTQGLATGPTDIQVRIHSGLGAVLQYLKAQHRANLSGAYSGSA